MTKVQYLQNLLPCLSSLNIPRAGIIPYTIVNGQIFIIFGLERGIGSISDFGGKKEANDRDLIDTALREFREETLNQFPEISREGLINLNPICLYDDITFEILFPLIIKDFYHFTVAMNDFLGSRQEAEIYSIFFISPDQLNNIVRKILEDYLNFRRRENLHSPRIDNDKLFVLHPKLLRLFLTRSLEGSPVLPLNV